MDSDDASESVGRPQPGFFNGPNVWVLIPLAGISIPIVAILADSPLMWVLAALLVIGALTAAARHLIAYHHTLRLDELSAQERIALAERDRFTAVDRLLEREGIPPVPPVHEPLRVFHPET